MFIIHLHVQHDGSWLYFKICSFPFVMEKKGDDRKLACMHVLTCM